MHSEDDLLPLSAIQHYVFCPRRAALVFIERLWAENAATREGGRLHQKTEHGKTELVNGVVIARSLALRSLRLGVIGVSDVVEFHSPAPDTPPGQTVELEGRTGRWTVFPVEYKRGKRRNERGYIQQLCGQALCLEEMLGVNVTNGAIFFGKTRRRLDVEFTTELREATQQTILRLHELINEQRTPAAKYEPKCDFCSLFDLCSPKSLKSDRSIQSYIRSIHTHESGEE